MMPPPIRLLHIVDSLQPGGMENVLLQLVNGLAPENFSSEICCLTKSGPFETRITSGSTVHVLHKSPGFQWSTVRALRELMRTGGYDIVHTRHLGGLNYAALAGMGRRRLRMVHSEHILWDKAELGWKRQWQRRLLYRMAACVFTVSQGQLQQMLDTGHRHRWQFCLPNGVDPARFHPPTESKPSLKQRLNLDPTSFWFGNVARFGTTKRHMDLIAAFELAVEHDPRLGLLLVGDGGSEKKAVLARIKASPARHRIHWAGFQQNPVIWYQAMDALVVASSFEGLPNSVLEGMACGIPILANDVCGVREILHHGKHGWVEDLSNVEKLTTALLRNAQTPAATLAEMGMDACAHARQEHSLSAMVAKYALMYAAAAADTPTDLDVQATSFSL